MKCKNQELREEIKVTRAKEEKQWLRGEMEGADSAQGRK